MTKLNITSMIIILLGVILILLNRFSVLDFSDGIVRIAGVLVLISLITYVYSSMKLRKLKK